MDAQFDEIKMYEVVKKAVAEVFDEKLEKLKLELIPYADDSEMEEINAIFGDPKKYENQDFEATEL
ncbi:unnamed protein product [marine sediment metagenome]|uniref:Uncharacterized protein n=1 Tax=marine sediment metagenome TaxID=412755 RepID=X1TSG2_9ZZZZ